MRSEKARAHNLLKVESVEEVERGKKGNEMRENSSNTDTNTDTDTEEWKELLGKTCLQCYLYMFGKCAQTI